MRTLSIHDDFQKIIFNADLDTLKAVARTIDACLLFSGIGGDRLREYGQTGV
jgi:hypothetical protein